MSNINSTNAENIKENILISPTKAIIVTSCPVKKLQNVTMAYPINAKQAHITSHITRYSK